jgi:hypothetical protein
MPSAGERAGADPGGRRGAARGGAGRRGAARGGAGRRGAAPPVGRLAGWAGGSRLAGSRPPRPRRLTGRLASPGRLWITAPRLWKFAPRLWKFVSGSDYTCGDRRDPNHSRNRPGRGRPAACRGGQGQRRRGPRVENVTVSRSGNAPGSELARDDTGQFGSPRPRPQRRPWLRWLPFLVPGTARR